MSFIVFLRYLLEMLAGPWIFGRHEKVSRKLKYSFFLYSPISFSPRSSPKQPSYDDLYNYIVNTKCIVTCCIDAHFTAFQIINPKTLLYYDPLSPTLRVAKGEGEVQKVALFLLLKCNYGDNQHIQENKSHYTGATSSGLQRTM